MRAPRPRANRCRKFMLSFASWLKCPVDMTEKSFRCKDIELRKQPCFAAADAFHVHELFPLISMLIRLPSLTLFPWRPCTRRGARCCCSGPGDKEPFVPPGYSHLCPPRFPGPVAGRHGK